MEKNINNHTIKKLVLSLILSIGSFLILPAYAWPEVDHMNMCGAATKSVRAYGGNWQGWNQHDSYIAKRGNAYYLRTNCPTTVASVKKLKKKVYRKPLKTVAKVKNVRIDKSLKAKKFKRSVKYDEHADCARVDRLNSYGDSVSQQRK